MEWSQIPLSCPAQPESSTVSPSTIPPLASFPAALPSISPPLCCSSLLAKDLSLSVPRPGKSLPGSGLLNLGSNNTWGQTILCYGGCSVPCRMSKSISRLYPLDTNSTSQDVAKFPSRAQSPQVENHLPGLCPPFPQISPLRPTLTHPLPPPRPPAPTHFTLLGSSKQLSSWLHGGLGSSSLLFPDRSPAPDTQLVSIHICWVNESEDSI